MQVFGIGLPRTATMSLARAFGLLGFATHHCYDHLEVGPEVEAGTDTPFWYIYPELDRRFPDARFVHVHRPVEDWIDSFRSKRLVEAHRRMVRRSRRQVQRKPRHAVDQHCYLGFFGREPLTRAGLRAKHAEHAELVATHFAGREDKLLSLPLAELDWPPLCGFLGLPEPTEPFPALNRTGAD